MRRLPRNVHWVPHNPKRPYQVRIQYQGQRFSLGYFATAADAEVVARSVLAEIREWRDMRLPPPSLHRQIRERARQAGSDQPQQEQD